MELNKKDLEIGNLISLAKRNSELVFYLFSSLRNPAMSATGQAHPENEALCEGHEGGRGHASGD